MVDRKENYKFDLGVKGFNWSEGFYMETKLVNFEYQ